MGFSGLDRNRGARRFNGGGKVAQSQLAGRRAEKTFGMLREAVLGGGTAGFRSGPPGVRPTSRSSCNMLGESNSPQILPVELCQSTKARIFPSSRSKEGALQ